MRLFYGGWLHLEISPTGGKWWQFRREGFLANEMDVSQPERESSLFSRFPHVRRQPYLGFATDILRLMLTGVQDPDELGVYAETAIASLTKGRLFRRAEETQRRTIWLTIWSFAKGNAPFVTCEFDRQAIPVRMKPTADELEDWLREVAAEIRQETDALRLGDGGVEATVDRFIASLQDQPDITLPIRTWLLALMWITRIWPPSKHFRKHL